MLDWLAQDFEPGVRYSERAGQRDHRAAPRRPATLRRYLVDEHLLDRAGGEYWRIGGTVRLTVAGSHYETLGVRPDASAAEIRDAYRRLARVHHPDHGDVDAGSMAAINEAYRVLGEPARRAVYDAARRGTGSAVRPRRRRGSRRSPRPRPVDTTPARYPWKLVLGMAAFGATVVLVGAALYEPAGPERPDNLLGPGSCVTIEGNGDAREVTCTGEDRPRRRGARADRRAVPRRDGGAPRPPGTRPRLRRPGTVTPRVRVAAAAAAAAAARDRRRRRRLHRRRTSPACRPSRRRPCAARRCPGWRRRRWSAGSSGWSCSSSSSSPSSPSSSA